MNIDDRLYVQIVPHQGERPMQLDPVIEGRFDAGYVYKVLGMQNPSGSSEAYFALANLQGQIWFVPQRSVRAYGLIDSNQLSLKLPSREKSAPSMPSVAGQLAGRLSTGARLARDVH